MSFSLWGNVHGAFAVVLPMLVAAVTDSRSFHPAQSQGSSGYASFAGSDRGRRKPSSLSSLPEEQNHHGLTSLHGEHHRQTPTNLPEEQHRHTPTNPPEERQHHAPTNDHALHPQPKHNYFRSSSEQLPTHGLGYPAGCSRNYPFQARDNTQVDDRDNYYSMNRSGGDGPFRIRDAPLQAGRRTFHTFGPQHQNQHTHPAWRRARGLDGGWRSVTPATSYATTDDDDLTTTSGSYTLSPDEPPSDMDEVPFHQVHDIMV